MPICIAITILFGATNSLGDPKSNLLQSRVDCRQMDCKQAYLKFINEKNPRLNKMTAREIISAVQHYAPRYFGEGVTLEVGTEITLSIMGVESHFKPNALGDIDHELGPAYSLMQILESTAEEAKKYNGIKSDKDLMALWDNIHLGMAEINRLHERYKGDWRATVTAYNMGHENVDRIIKGSGLSNYSDYWVKVRSNKNRINYIKEELYVNNLSAKLSDKGF